MAEGDGWAGCRCDKNPVVGVAYSFSARSIKALRKALISSRMSSIRIAQMRPNIRRFARSFVGASVRTRLPASPTKCSQAFLSNIQVHIFEINRPFQIDLLQFHGE